MARIPQENDGSGAVVNVSLEFAANVQGDDATAGMEAGLMKERGNLLAEKKDAEKKEDSDPEPPAATGVTP